MFNGKMKAVTFSYDDGVTQDKRLIEILDKYSLKATFNINSMLLGHPGSLVREGVDVSHNKVKVEELAELYKNHEVAVHTLTHPNLTTLEDDNEIIRQVEEDRNTLTQLVGYEVVGMAYPCGGINNNDRVAEIIKNHTGVKYSRTTQSTYCFDLQDNLYRFHPTVYHCEFGKMFELGEKFISLTPDKPQMYYIWGHSYEFDIYKNWDTFDEFCKLISNREDIYYGTNTQVLLTNIIK